MVKDDFFFKSATLNRPKARVRSKPINFFNPGKSSLKNPTMNVFNSGKLTRNNLIVRSKSFNTFNSGKAAKNIFNSGKSTKPVNLFGDKDRDGVSNVFDCKPNNPKEEGFFAAVVGAVKGAFTKGGSARAGWREGMERKRFATGREKKVNREKISSYDEMMPKVIKEDKKEERKQKVKRLSTRVSKGGVRAIKTIHRALSPTAYTKKGVPYKQTWQEYLVAARRQIQTGHVPRDVKTKRAVPGQLVSLMFPVPGMASGSGSTVKGRSSGRRGRPRGSYAMKYAKYQGVFGYRKAKAAQKALMKYKAELAAQKARTQAMTQAMPQYETQQYTPEQA